MWNIVREKTFSIDRTVEHLVPAANLDTDTFRCSKCKAIWRAQREYFDEGISQACYYPNSGNCCPNGCTNLFGVRKRGKLK